MFRLLIVQGGKLITEGAGVMLPNIKLLLVADVTGKLYLKRRKYIIKCQNILWKMVFNSLKSPGRMKTRNSLIKLVPSHRRLWSHYNNSRDPKGSQTADSLWFSCPVGGNSTRQQGLTMYETLQCLFLPVFTVTIQYVLCAHFTDEENWGLRALLAFPVHSLPSTLLCQYPTASYTDPISHSGSFRKI